MVLLLKRCRWSMNGYVMLTSHSLDGNLFIEGKVLLTCAHDNCLFVCVESVLLVIGGSHNIWGWTDLWPCVNTSALRAGQHFIYICILSISALFSFFINYKLWIYILLWLCLTFFPKVMQLLLNSCYKGTYNLVSVVYFGNCVTVFKNVYNSKEIHFLCILPLILNLTPRNTH